MITYAGITIGAVNMIFIQPRLLTEEELGLTRLLYFCAYLTGLLLPLGLPHIIVKFFPVIRDPKARHHGFHGLVVLVLAVGFALCSAALVLLRPQITAYYAGNSQLFVSYFGFLLPFTLIVSLVTVATTYCQSLFKSTVPAFLNDIVVRIGIAVVTILYFNRVMSLDAYVIAYIGIYGVELLLLILFILSVDSISLWPRINIFTLVDPGTMLRFGMVMCAAGFASYGLRTADTILLGRSSLALVGVYTTAVFVASFIEVPLGALERISHTKVADHYSRNELDAVARIYRESVNYLLIAGGFLFVGINACVSHVYRLGGLPESYFSSIDVVYIVGLGALVNVSTGVNSAIIFYSRYYLLGTLLMMVTLAVTIALNLWLIPLYGIYGAAFSSLAGASLYNIAKFVAIYLGLGLQPYSRKTPLVIAVIAACTAVAHLLPQTPGGAVVNLFFAGSVSCGLYIALLVVLRLDPPELRNLAARAGLLFSARRSQ
jgi:O-antigen/teichoic acid export membrane protein